MVFRQQSLTRTLRLIRTYFFSENGKNYPKTGPSHLSVSRFCKNHKHFSREYVSHTRYGFHDDCKYYFLGAIPLLIVYIYHKKYHILPSVKAATIKSDSPRSQFNFIADVVEGSTDSVVCIDIKNTQRLDFFSGIPPSTMGNGSGFIIDSDGLILTNAHVVMGHPQSAIQVKLANGTIYPGKVEDIDVHSDLAAIRIKPKGKLSPLKLGESKSLRAGEWVIAMGSPLTLSNTVTAGIVSSAHRTSSELQLHGKDMHYIQTDASITFGNSGGPLINLDGEVVGINSMKVAEAGISFAIPIEYAKDFLQRSKNRKSDPRPTQRYLGLTMIGLNKDILRELQYRDHYVPRDIEEGAIVWKVVIGSPAHRGGLIPGDIVVEINGTKVKSSNTVYEAMDKNSVLNLKIFRGNGYYEVVVYPEDIV